MIQFKEVPAADIPLALLLEADPSESSIQAYLSSAWCFGAIQNGQIIGVCVAGLMSEDCGEIFNVAVYPPQQQHGIGSKLLNFAITALKHKGLSRLELGTGTFGHQLTFYQRLGFRVDCVWKNHFIDNYPEPIFESGIQHQDMLRLYLELN